MAYEKQNFLDGQIVTADHLNHMENGIVAAQNPRNLLDNSDFTNPVNQRGAASYSGVCYTIDRWRSWGESMQINVSNGGIIVSGGALYQYVLCEPSKTYTAAIYLSDGTIICSSGVPSENGIGDYNTLWVDRSDDNLMFRIGFDAIEHKYVWAALYEGAYDASTLPPYIPKGYAAELAECHRYFWRCNNTWFSEGIGYAFSDTQYRVSIVLPQMMRVTPTMISSTGNTTSYGIKIHTAGGANITPTAVTLSMKNNRIALTLAGTFTNGELGVLRLENDYLDFSADL